MTYVKACSGKCALSLISGGGGGHRVVGNNFFIRSNDNVILAPGLIFNNKMYELIALEIFPPFKINNIVDFNHIAVNM